VENKTVEMVVKDLLLADNRKKKKILQPCDVQLNSAKTSGDITKASITTK